MIRRFLALLALGIVAPVAQGAGAAVAPAGFVPDLSLLVAVAAALVVPGGEGLLVAVAAGYAADLLSGAPLGHHAFLNLAAFTLTWMVSAQFHLRRGLALALFAFGLTILDAAATAGLSRLFSGDARVGLEGLRLVPIRGLANAFFAPAVRLLFSGIATWLNESERKKRDVHLDTRRPAL